MWLALDMTICETTMVFDRTESSSRTWYTSIFLCPSSISFLSTSVSLWVWACFNRAVLSLVIYSFWYNEQWTISFNFSYQQTLLSPVAYKSGWNSCHVILYLQLLMISSSSFIVIFRISLYHLQHMICQHLFQMKDSFISSLPFMLKLFNLVE